MQHFRIMLKAKMYLFIITTIVVMQLSLCTAQTDTIKLEFINGTKCKPDQKNYHFTPKGLDYKIFFSMQMPNNRILYSSKCHWEYNNNKNTNYFKFKNNTKLGIYYEWSPNNTEGSTVYNLVCTFYYYKVDAKNILENFICGRKINITSIYKPKNDIEVNSAVSFNMAVNGETYKYSSQPSGNYAYYNENDNYNISCAYISNTLGDLKLLKDNVTVNSRKISKKCIDFNYTAIEGKDVNFTCLLYYKKKSYNITFTLKIKVKDQLPIEVTSEHGTSEVLTNTTTAASQKSKGLDWIVYIGVGAGIIIILLIGSIIACVQLRKLKKGKDTTAEYEFFTNTFPPNIAFNSNAIQDDSIEHYETSAAIQNGRANAIYIYAVPNNNDNMYAKVLPRKYRDIYSTPVDNIENNYSNCGGVNYAEPMHRKKGGDEEGNYDNVFSGTLYVNRKDIK